MTLCSYRSSTGSTLLDTSCRHAINGRYAIIKVSLLFPFLSIWQCSRTKRELTGFHCCSVACSGGIDRRSPLKCAAHAPPTASPNHIPNNATDHFAIHIPKTLLCIQQRHTDECPPLAHCGYMTGQHGNNCCPGPKSTAHDCSQIGVHYMYCRWIGLD